MLWCVNDCKDDEIIVRADYSVEKGQKKRLSGSFSAISVNIRMTYLNTIRQPAFIIAVMIMTTLLSIIMKLTFLPGLDTSAIAYTAILGTFCAMMARALPHHILEPL